MKKRRGLFDIQVERRIQDKYSKDLVFISKEVDKIIKTYISRLGKYRVNLTERDVRIIIDSLNSYSTSLSGWARKQVERMINQLKSRELDQWNKNIVKLDRIMKAKISEEDMNREIDRFKEDNVELISSLPKRAAKRVQDIVVSSVASGKSQEELVDDILKVSRTTRANALLIARTETTRVITGITKIRSKSLGMDWFIWNSVHDNITRPGHKLLDGVIVRWDDPPSPESLAGEKFLGMYLPGSIFNCRCSAVPLVELDDTSWPARVYRNGSIMRMNKSQFIELNNRIGNTYYKKVA